MVENGRIFPVTIQSKPEGRKEDQIQQKPSFSSTVGNLVEFEVTSKSNVRYLDCKIELSAINPYVPKLNDKITVEGFQCAITKVFSNRVGSQILNYELEATSK